MRSSFRFNLIVIAVLLVLLLLSFLVFRYQKPQWDHSAQSVLIDIDEFAIERDYNYLPPVRVWGDGRIVWVTFDALHYRHVNEGQLQEAELQHLLEQLVAHRFTSSLPFPFLSVQSGDLEVSINLADGQTYHNYQEKNLSVQQQELIAFLKNGAGAVGHPLIPKRARLYVTESKAAKHFFVWPDKAFGYSLDSVGDAHMLKPEEILWVFDQINRGPDAVVRSNGKFYWIALLIPGLSSVE